MRASRLPCAALAALLLSGPVEATPDPAQPAAPTLGAKPAPHKKVPDQDKLWQEFGAKIRQLSAQFPDGVIPEDQIIGAAESVGLDTGAKDFQDRLHEIFPPKPPDQAVPKPNVPINQTTPDPGTTAKPATLNPGQQVVLAGDNRGIQANPGNPLYFRQRGLDYSSQGNYQGAYTDLDKVVSNGNPDVQTLDAYGDAAYQLGDYQTAHSAALLALQMDPNDKSAFSLMKFTEGRSPAVHLPSALGGLGGLADGSSSRFSAAPNGPAGGPAAPAPGGFSAAALPPPSMTPEQAAALAQRQPGGGADAVLRSAQFTRDAQGALQIRDYPTAYGLSSQAIALNAQNAQALNYRATALVHMRRYSDAVQDASAALNLAPGNAATLATRSWAFAKQGKYKDALEDASLGLLSAPSSPALYRDKAFALAGLGDRDGAVEALRAAAASDPGARVLLERALQLPKDADMTLLFDDGAAAAAAAPAAAAPAPAPGSRERRFVRLIVLSLSGGLLIALGILHVVSASWRERMRLTVRRALAAPDAGEDGAVLEAAPAGGGAFWTQYEVIKEIGLGGMGVVYEAKDRSLERRVAIKKMRDEIRLDAHDRQRFVNEARTVAQLHHPNIVDIYGIVEDGMDVYLVFEFVEGRTLQDALKNGALDFEGARRVLKEIAAAVEHAHERGVIHRDLKPSNIMLTPEGRVKVMDFGIARQAKDALTRHSMTNTVAGTPPYMAPEQEQGTVRKESDVYALGVCLYEMVTGFLPFGGSGAAMLLNKLNGKHLPPSQRTPTLPPGFDAVVARVLSPDPDKRYRTPAELAGALDALTPAVRA